MNRDPILITTQYEAEKFATFLELPDNHRILFSGKYGSGKTYFLHEFFTARKKDEYEVFHLFPTNYAIAKNEDVVKSLQFDILYELLIKGYLAPSEKLFTAKETMAGFVQNNFPNIIKKIVSHCGQIGKKLSDVYETYSKWDNGISMQCHFDSWIYADQSLDIKIKYKCESYNREIYADAQMVSHINGSERKKIPISQFLSIALENYCGLIETNDVIRY